MTNRSFKILILTFFSLMLFSCKNDKTTMKQAEAEVYFRYIEMTQALHAETFFFEKKKPVVWDNVLFVNMPMKKRQLSPEQIRYIFDFQQPEFKNQYYVKFWNKGELPRQIDIEPSGVNSFSFKNASGKPIELIEKNKPAVLAIDAPAFSGKEKFTLLFTNENNESASLEIAPPNASGQVGLSEKALATIPTGICNAELIISKAEAVETPAAKANIISEFYSKPVQIVVR